MMSAEIAFLLAAYLLGVLAFRWFLGGVFGALSMGDETCADWVFYFCWFIGLPIILICLAIEYVMDRD